MISCTEFIPAYSELFSYLDENLGGHGEVERFWTYLFKPDGKGIPLINFAKKEGLRGCWNYWEGTLKEEAADVSKYMSEKDGWIFSVMHHCPSKGRLLELEKEIGLKPYYDYCGHCDYYRASLEEVGLTWIRNHIKVNEAGCQSLLYDPKVFKGIIVPREDMDTMEIRSSDREYFHPGFHSSMNRGIEYLGSIHGAEHVKAYLSRYVKNVYKKTLESGKKDPFGAIESKIRESYEQEKAAETLSIQKDENSLSVQISSCPAVSFLKEIGAEISPYFRYTTESVMEALASELGVHFQMESYDEATGAASYRFYQ